MVCATKTPFSCMTFPCFSESPFPICSLSASLRARPANSSYIYNIGIVSSIHRRDVPLARLQDDNPNGVEPSITAYRQMCGVDEPTLPTHDPNGVEPYKASTGATHSGSNEKRWLSCDPPVFNRRLTRCDPCRVETIPSISWSTLRLYMGIRQFIDYQIIGGEQKQDGLKDPNYPIFGALLRK